MELCTEPGKMIARLRWMREPAADLAIPKSAACGYSSVLRKGESWLAILGGKVFMGTLDSHVIALDTKTGNVIWDVTAVDYTKGYSFTLAPLVIKNLVLVGISGGEYGIRGFIDAYDANSGERKWRFYTVPAPGEPGSDTWEGESLENRGSPAWITGAYDVETNTRSGPREILRLRIAAKDAPEITCIRIRCWRSIRIPEN